MTTRIEISEEAISFLTFVRRMLKGEITRTDTLPNFGTWDVLAKIFWETYQEGYSLQGKLGAIDFLEKVVKVTCEKDSAFATLFNTITEIDSPFEIFIKNRIPVLPASLRWDTSYGKSAREWLDQYIEWSSYWATRGHHLMHEACGIWLLSALAAGRIFIPFGGRFTSLYIVLAAKSGTYTKTTVMNNGKAMFRHIGLGHLLLTSDATPEAFYRQQSGAIPDEWHKMTEEERAIAQLIIAYAGKPTLGYDELGLHLQAMARPNGNMARWQRIMLRWADDIPEDYNDTIARGRDIVYRPYLSILGGMTIAHAQDLPKTANFWGDGLFGRMTFITPPKGTFSYADRNIGKQDFPDTIAHPLVNMHKRLGLPSVLIVPELKENGQESKRYKCIREKPYPLQECIIEPDVIQMYNDYSRALTRVANEQSALVPEEIAPNYTRMPDKMLQVAALLAWLNNGGCIAKEHMLAAAGIVEEHWRPSLHEFYSQVFEVDTTAIGKDEKKIMDKIEQAAPYGGLSITTLMQTTKINAINIKKHLEALHALGLITSYDAEPKRGKRKVTMYTLPGQEEPFLPKDKNKEKGAENG